MACGVRACDETGVGGEEVAFMVGISIVLSSAVRFIVDGLVSKLISG